MINYFKNYLSKISWIKFILQVIPIPIGIVTAKLMADVVNNATSGNVNKVLMTAIIILTIAISMKLFEVITGIIYEKLELQNIHKCKIELYKQYLSNPLSVLFTSKYGEAIEKLDNDFKIVTDKRLSLYPDFWSGSITIIVYFVFFIFAKSNHSFCFVRYFNFTNNTSYYC